jgi:hypothetical protein
MPDLSSLFPQPPITAEPTPAPALPDSSDSINNSFNSLTAQFISLFGALRETPEAPPTAEQLRERLNAIRE